jgi:uncharacterized membrane protein YesL
MRHYNTGSMIDAFRVVVKTFKDIWGEMFNLVLMNVFTLLCVVVIIPGPPAVMALYAVCNRIANDYAVSWDHYFAAFREHFRRGWLYAIFASVVSVLIVFNFWWYGATFGSEVWVQWVQGAWLAASFFWLVINFYVAAFYMEQQDRRWRVALRNSALVAGANPLFTLTLLVVVGLLMVVALAITPLFVLLGLSTWAMFGSEAVVNRVNLYRKRMEAQTALGSEIQGQRREV